MTDSRPSLAPRRRRAFTLRVAMGFVLLASLGLGWLVARSKAQRRAIEAIEASGGVVGFDYELTPYDSLDSDRPIPGPRWPRAIAGDELFRSIVYVALVARKTCDDQALSEVAHFPRLEILELEGSAVTDSGLAHIRGLRHLRRLGLAGTRVTDAGLANLEGLDSLNVLDLTGTDITDAGLVHLSGLRNLWHLGLSETSVGDAGMASLAGLRGLGDLDLEKTRVGKAGLQKLCGLDRLTHLTISGADNGGADCLKAKRPHVQISWVTWR